MSDQNIELFNHILEREFQGISLENQIMLLIIETCIVFIPGLIFLIKKKTSFGKLLHVYLLVLYLGVILTMTIFRRPIGTRPGIVHLNVDTGFSFGGIVSYWSAAFSTLNTILFIPWGMIICPFFSKKSPITRILITTIIGAFTSLFIEITQLHTATGMFELTDIVTNTAGTFIGAIVVAVLCTIFRPRKGKEQMVKRFLIILGSICSILILVAIGYNYCDQDVFMRKDDVTFYSNLNIFNYFRFRKSTWDSGEPQELRWKAKNVFCKDGKMVLELCNEEPKLTGGEVCTKRTFGFGLYQVRMKPIKNTGVVSAFFTYDKVGDEGTEIDIEFLGYDTTKVQFNYYTNGVGGHEYLYDLGFDASEEFHEYAFNWTEDSIQWFVDGELAHEVKSEDIPQMKAKIMMDVWAGDKPGWLKEYDGASPLYAYYDWVSYKELQE